MKYQGSLFFNYEAFKDTILIVINNKAVPNRIVQKDDVCGLYLDSELIGVNIFHSNDYLKLRLEGLLHTPNNPLVQLIYSLIKTNLNEEVEIVPSIEYVGQLKEKQGSNYIVSFDECEERKVVASLYGETSLESDYVLLVGKNTRLDNGDMSDEYILPGANYLIVGEEEDISSNSLGSQTYLLSSKK